MKEHFPCGHWHKKRPPYTVAFPAGRWIYPISQKGTPYLYVYDLYYDEIFKLDFSRGIPEVTQKLALGNTYRFFYTTISADSRLNAYCIDPDGHSIWYFLNNCWPDRDPIFISGEYAPNGEIELIEVNVQGSSMGVVGNTIFSGLMNSERPIDGCSDGTYTYWVTSKKGGHFIKIRNSDHTIMSDVFMDWLPADACPPSIAWSAHTQCLYTVYTIDDFHALLIKMDTDFNILTTTPLEGYAWSMPVSFNIVRAIDSYVLFQRNWFPSYGPMFSYYAESLSYTGYRADNPYLQQIFGTKGSRLFTLHLTNNFGVTPFLACFRWPTLELLGDRNIEYYGGHMYLVDSDWYWTSESGMPDTVNVVAFFRYHTTKKVNIVTVFDASEEFDIMSDTELTYITYRQYCSYENEPMRWTMP